MAEFFRLNAGEDKVITREERIFFDAMKITHGMTVEVKTTSKAPAQKLKTYVAATEIPGAVTAIGSYYEIEHGNYSKLQQGFIPGTITPPPGYENTTYIEIGFSYFCERIGEGEYKLTFHTNPTNLVVYCEHGVLQDSYFEPLKGWLNGDNPDTLQGKFTYSPPYGINNKWLYESLTGYWLENDPIYANFFYSRLPITESNGKLETVEMPIAPKNYFKRVISISGVIDFYDPDSEYRFVAPLQHTYGGVEDDIKITTASVVLATATDPDYVSLYIRNSTADWSDYEVYIKVEYTKL